MEIPQLSHSRILRTSQMERIPSIWWAAASAATEIHRCPRWAPPWNASKRRALEVGGSHRWMDSLRYNNGKPLSYHPKKRLRGSILRIYLRYLNWWGVFFLCFMWKEAAGPWCHSFWGRDSLHLRRRSSKCCTTCHLRTNIGTWTWPILGGKYSCTTQVDESWWIPRSQNGPSVPQASRPPQRLSVVS